MEPKVVEVKGILRQGLSLFGTMMRTVESLAPGQALVVKSTFHPAPLIAHMRRRGYRVEQRQEGRTLITTFVPEAKDGPDAAGDHAPFPAAALPVEGPEHRLDNRGLVPPEPMQRTLALLDEVPPGHVVVIHNDRVPVFLLAELDRLGYPYEIQAQPDESAVVRILKPPEDRAGEAVPCLKPSGRDVREQQEG
ncbi:MAG: DUF2249 domain-containing protein [Firmicutes bacterium]|nr:DUF2249 domain-containing protein [Alicyclobacillaceae bacterium]MCL6496732.1 DUF2249 domain-containing protein [Bacillota bacterium]